MSDVVLSMSCLLTAMCAALAVHGEARRCKMPESVATPLALSGFVMVLAVSAWVGAL